MSLLKKCKAATPAGRKYRLAILCLLFILAAFGLATMNPILLKVFAEVVGGIVGIYIVYCGGNVATKGVLGKWQGATVETVTPDTLENPQGDERGE